MTALQLYGIVPLEPGMSSPVGDTSLVGFRSIAAIVAPAEYRRFDPNEAVLNAYAQVIEAIFENMPILPAPPATVFRSRAVLSRWLELHYVALTEALGALEGVATARVTIRLKDGPLTDRTLTEWQGLATDSVRILRRRSSAISSLADNGSADPSLVSRTSFMVARDRWEDFAAGVQAERERNPHLEYTLTGPWPPYDFVRMQFES